VPEIKQNEYIHDSDFDSEKNKWKQIIDEKPTTTIAATTIRPEEPEELEEGERLFYSQMWVKWTPLHFIVNNGSQNNLVLFEGIFVSIFGWFFGTWFSSWFSIFG
jgi:hypothetical protein